MTWMQASGCVVNIYSWWHRFNPFGTDGTSESRTELIRTCSLWHGRQLIPVHVLCRNLESFITQGVENNYLWLEIQDEINALSLIFKLILIYFENWCEKDFYPNYMLNIFFCSVYSQFKQNNLFILTCFIHTSEYVRGFFCKRIIIEKNIYISKFSIFSVLISFGKKVFSNIILVNHKSRFIFVWNEFVKSFVSKKIEFR